MNPRNFLLSIPIICAAVAAARAEPPRVDFAREVRPILERSCGKCHGAEKQKGGLRFDRRKDAFVAGDSGRRALVPGKADDSELIRRLETAEADERMPPKSDPLPARDIKLLRDWIDQGAAWPESNSPTTEGRSEMVVTADDRQHWSYRPLRDEPTPAATQSGWGRTPVDAFIAAALDARGIRPNPPTARRTLIRRLSFDLIGLPPAPEDVDAFVADPDPDAYNALVARLLDSKHYGERWGRHWLDVARYADSNGMESDDDRPTAHHYRDFVIRALNDDLPFNTFVRWQLAGDEYEPDNPLALAATGFLAAGPSENLNVPMEEEKLRLRFNELDDMSVTTMSAFLGLTLGCARCHDHKFDAIPTRDYYRLQCAFTTTGREQVPLAPRAEVAKARELEANWAQRFETARKRLNDWLKEQKSPHTAALRSAKVEALSINADEKKLLLDQPDSEPAKKLAKQHEKGLRISDEDYRGVFNDAQRTQWDAFKNEVDAVQRARPPQLPTALAVIDKKAEPEPTWLLNRGDFYAKRDLLQVGFLTVLTGSRPPEEYWAAAREAAPPGLTTGQRRALAEWLTDVDHGAGPLLARVIVNRVWLHHFGEGLVRTVGDFGVRGEKPSHPELLEWLARRLVSDGWRLKSLHSLILRSAVYTQSTAFDAPRAQIDPENRLLWRRRPQRFEAEILRDSVLAVSGTLNPQQFGPAFKPPIPAEAMLARNTKDPYPKDARDTLETRKRSVYMFHKRVVQNPLMQAFDGPDAAVSCGRRAATTVAPQALALLNDTFLRDRAVDFAKRLLAENLEKPADWALRGFRLALSRPPHESEAAAAVQFIESQLARRAARDASVPVDEIRVQALADFCQALFSLNEFMYVD